MLDNEVLRKLRELRLPELIEIVERYDLMPDVLDLPFNDRLAMMIDDLYLMKADGRIKRLQKQAKLRYPQADIISINFVEDRKLDKYKIKQLASSIFISSKMNLSIYGATGSGKTYLACALANNACKFGYRSRYIRFPDLLDKYAVLTDKATKMRFINRYSNYDLLVIDEWLKTVPSEEELCLLFELTEQRYEKNSTLLCSLYPPCDWIIRMGSSTMSESICDRLIHGLITVDCGSYNMREYMAKNNPKPW